MNLREQNLFLNRISKLALKEAKRLALRDRGETAEVTGGWLKKKYKQATINVL